MLEAVSTLTPGPAPSTSLLAVCPPPALQCPWNALPKCLAMACNKLTFNLVWSSVKMLTCTDADPLNLNGGKNVTYGMFATLLGQSKGLNAGPAQSLDCTRSSSGKAIHSTMIFYNFYFNKSIFFSVNSPLYESPSDYIVDYRLMWPISKFRWKAESGYYVAKAGLGTHEIWNTCVPIRGTHILQPW